jgi:transposase
VESSRRIDLFIVKRVQKIAATSTSVEYLRRCQAVLLPPLFGATLERTADVPGVGRGTVARLQAVFRKQRSVLRAVDRNWGGRRQSLLSPEEVVALLGSRLDRSATGNLVVVSPMRAALAQWLGQPVKPSVVYRLLARHGWQKWRRTPVIPRADLRFRRLGKTP